MCVLTLPDHLLHLATGVETYPRRLSIEVASTGIPLHSGVDGSEGIFEFQIYNIYTENFLEKSLQPKM